MRAPWEWDVKRRLRGIEFPVALFDTAGALVPGNGGADMIWASALASEESTANLTSGGNPIDGRRDFKTS